jgi:hypothetical protein
MQVAVHAERELAADAGWAASAGHLRSGYRGRAVLGATLDHAVIGNEVNEMHGTKCWSVVVDVDEHDGRTRAIARLDRGRSEDLVGVGLARLSPADRDVPEIGDELAAARALSELSHRLLDAAADDIEQVTHEPADLRI